MIERRIIKITASPVPGDKMINVYYLYHGTEFKVGWDGEHFYTNTLHPANSADYPDFYSEMAGKVEEFLVRE